MFIKLGDRVLNTDAIVEAKITPARERRMLTAEEAVEWDYPLGDELPAREISVDVVTTATTSSYDDGGDFPESKHTDFCPYTIRLQGSEAEALLDVLTTIEPLPPIFLENKS